MTLTTIACERCGTRFCENHRRPHPNLCSGCLEVLHPARDVVLCADGCGTEVGNGHDTCGWDDCVAYARADAQGRI